ncbi:MAG: hypothetical protein ACW98J_00905 [Candidatus Thorarchaeota archaeon]|jgi:hypothetical protein
MIVTVATVVVLVIGVLSLCLALYGGFVSTTIMEGLEQGSEQHHQSEQRYYLLGMIGIIVLSSRVLIAPIFFWMLQSLVPYCPGAMCSYGVVNVSSPYSDIATTLKLLLPFAYGAWLVIELANRREPALPLMRSLARSFLILLLPLIIIDSAADIFIVAAMRPVYAPCCSSVYDVDPPFSPSSILGPEFGMMILLVTIALILVLIGIQWSERFSERVPLLTLILSVLVSVLYLVMLHDTYAPLVLGLSNHHCPYCLFQEFPDTAFFSGLFWFGVASAGWKVILELVWKNRDMPTENIMSLSSLLRKISSVALLFSLVSILSHLSMLL